jgi:hypothetical protein
MFITLIRLSYEGAFTTSSSTALISDIFSFLRSYSLCYDLTHSLIRSTCKLNSLHVSNHSSVRKNDSFCLV